MSAMPHTEEQRLEDSNEICRLLEVKEYDAGESISMLLAMAMELGINCGMSKDEFLSLVNTGYAAMQDDPQDLS